MKNLLKTNLAISTSLILALFLLIPHQASAWGLPDLADLATVVPGYLIRLVILPLMSYLVYFSGMVLNISIGYSVVDMAKHISTAGIDNAWSVVRDVANMGFIFVLIYTALQTMFGFGEYQKTIRNMVIAAILINFSLYFTKAIIDASNILALFFYKAIAPNALDMKAGISTSFMDKINIQSIYSSVDALRGTELVIIGIGGIAIYLITSFVFLAVAAMFIVRYLILIFVLVLSPLMFIGDIIPNAGKYTSQWKEALTGQALFAPLYFLMTWITLKLAQGLFPSGSGDLAGALSLQHVGANFKANPSGMETIINFVLIIGFLIGSLVIAKSTSGKAGNMITSKLTGLAGGATFGMAAKAGRGTIGRAGAALASSEKVKNAIEKGGAAGMAGRLALSAGNKTAKASFDGRAAFGLGGMLGAGQGKSGGFEKDVKDRNKKAVDEVKLLGLDKKAADAKKIKEAAEKKLQDAQAAHADAAKQAHGDAAKSADLVAAEKAEARAQEHINGPLKATDAMRQAHTDAKARADALREEHVRQQGEVLRARESFIADRTVDERADVDKATENHSNLEKRADDFITKQGEPTISLPDYAQRYLNTKHPKIGAVIENIGKEGLGGVSAPYAEQASNFVSAKAEQIREGVRQLPKAARIPATPLAWLGTKFIENGVQAASKMVGSRQEERKARVEAIRKELKKTDADKAQEKLLAALDKVAKKDEKAS